MGRKWWERIKPYLEVIGHFINVREMAYLLLGAAGTAVSRLARLDRPWLIALMWLPFFGSIAVIVIRHRRDRRALTAPKPGSLAQLAARRPAVGHDSRIPFPLKVHFAAGVARDIVFEAMAAWDGDTIVAPSLICPDCGAIIDVRQNPRGAKSLLGAVAFLECRKCRFEGTVMMSCDELLDAIRWAFYRHEDESGRL